MKRILDMLLGGNAGDPRFSDDIRAALNVGTTLTTRLWIALHSIVLGLQLSVGQPSMFSNEGFQIFFKVVPVEWWAWALLVSGLTMFWRTVSYRPRPLWAWISNSLAVGLWSTIVIMRVWVVGPYGFLSSSTVVLIMAVWCNIRTEATKRDKETA